MKSKALVTFLVAVSFTGLTTHAESVSNEFQIGESAVYCKQNLPQLNTALLTDVSIAMINSQGNIFGRIMRKPFSVSSPAYIDSRNDICVTLTKQ